MSGAVHLIGGGWGGDGGAWRGFLQDAERRAGGRVPRVLVVAVREADAAEHVSKLAQTLRAAGAVEVVAHPVPLGADLPAELFDDGLHGVLVGGGLTPAYLDALAPHGARLRALLDAGVPYAGFSAGSAIAARRALVGGWLQDGLPVLAEEASEGLGPLTVVDGLGLVPFTVDVHAAQWGTLARLVTAVDAGLVDWGAAIDEDTALVVHGDDEHVEGAGAVWWAEGGDGAVAVRRETGASEPRSPRPLRRAR